MTAFARTEKQADWGHAVWELRSVNHRYLEFNFVLPEPFHYLEAILRKQLNTYLQRGRVDIKLHYKPPVNPIAAIEIDENMTMALIQAYTQIAQLAQSSCSLNPSELLRWPHLLRFPEVAYETLQPRLIALFSETLMDLCRARLQEGEAIFTLIQPRLLKLTDLIQHVKDQLPAMLDLQREKILTRFSEAKLSVDPSRLEQEMLLFVQRTDVAEELDRLQIHLRALGKHLTTDKVQGKKLDFLLQELNREANTLAAKSLQADLNLAAVNMKVLIEEIREQVQNIE